MEKALFTLLRLGLETCNLKEVDILSISNLTREEWIRLKELSERQGTTALVLDGIERLQAQGVTAVNMPLEMKLEWIGEALQLEQANLQQRDVMNDLAKKWTVAGCRVMVMKGQANGTFYPKPLHRSTGDIDCYLFENYAKGNDKARQVGADVDESWYKHSVINYKGETFENHQFFVHTRDGKGRKLLEKELEEALQVDASQFAMLGEYVICPPVQWTAMFLTYHACAHFISEGLNLKQLLDWAMFLNKHQNDVDWARYYKFCSRHHLSRFAEVSTAIAKDYLGIKIINEAIKCESPYAERVLKSALYDDDYVFGSGKGNWHNRFHLVMNLWTYRWKYRDIYQMSPLRQLWYYATGFIFKTE